jgi:outer membrane receptor protein involved in Fe transport
VNLTWRYLSDAKRDLEDSQTYLQFLGTATGVYATDSKLGSRSYFDLSAAMTFAEKYNVRVGVNNALDKDPPLNGSGTCPSGPCNGNTWAQAYDVLGRQIFATASVQF